MGKVEALVLPDGRHLAWSEYGQPDGVPTMCFHGSPGTRAFLAAHDEEATSRGTRLIAPDRPGYGESSFHPLRTFASWASDVGRLADHLGIDRFAVLGASSGGPNAAAGAFYLGERIAVCALVSSAAPPDAGIAAGDLPRATRAIRRAATIAPGAVGFGFQLMLRQAQRAPDKAVATMSRALPACDEEVFNRPGIRQAARDELAQPVSRTAGRAAIQDLRLETSPWGFDIRDISVTVQIWQGGLDENVPAASGEYQAMAIPAAELHLVPSAGHLLVHSHFLSILDSLTT